MAQLIEENDMISVARTIFSNPPQEPFTMFFDIVDENGNEMEIQDIFEFLTILFHEGLKILFFNETNKIELHELSEDDFELIRKYFHSMGFEIFYNIQEINKINTPSNEENPDNPDNSDNPNNFINYDFEKEKDERIKNALHKKGLPDITRGIIDDNDSYLQQLLNNNMNNTNNTNNTNNKNNTKEEIKDFSFSIELDNLKYVIKFDLLDKSKYFQTDQLLKQSAY